MRDLLGGDGALHGRRVDDRAHGIIGDLEATAIVAGDAVDHALADVDPDRERRVVEARVAAGRTEVDGGLPRRADLRPEDVWKELAEPWAAREDDVIGGERGAVAQRDAAHH